MELIHDESGNGITYSDNKVLVISQNLNSVQNKDDNMQFRYNILHICCTLYSKICNIIIDGGNCENCVSKKMINR